MMGMGTTYVVDRKVVVISRMYNTDHYGETGTVSEVDATEYDTAYLVQFETGAEWMYGDELSPVDGVEE